MKSSTLLKFSTAIAEKGDEGSLARQVLDAYPRIRGGALHTPLMRSPWLAQECTGAESVWLKLESEQHHNAFKCRGALNKMCLLSREQLAAGVYTSSTGNHALGILHATRWLTQGLLEEAAEGGGPQAPLEIPLPHIYVPTTISPYKLQRLEQQGAHVTQVGSDCVESEVAAALAAQEAGACYVSPYNDQAVMAGQGTIAVEVLLDLMRHDRVAAAVAKGEQRLMWARGGGDAGAKAAEAAASAAAPAGEGVPLPPELVVFVPVGGGGLIAGIASFLKAVHPPGGVKVVGCQPRASAIMAASVQAGRILDLPSGPTLSDATAGGVEEGALTLEPCTKFVDEWVLLEEAEIQEAMVLCLEQHCKLIEGAAGCAVAACLKMGRQGGLKGKRAVVIVCGGNVALSTLKQVLLS